MAKKFSAFLISYEGVEHFYETFAYPYQLKLDNIDSLKILKSCRLPLAKEVHIIFLLSFAITTCVFIVCFFFFLKKIFSAFICSLYGSFCSVYYQNLILHLIALFFQAMQNLDALSANADTFIALWK
ncbi:hypothetical protein wVul_1477 [Wolbachia endosymbiont of Armadillidium vulgare str. wVulC]|nr:hypothetical protein wVul_1477 [Wolbachia endosymbiont of Armadillidium vulgare str. wVulC]